MAERKPGGLEWEDWISRQIRLAQERGAFDDLPGSGKPIPDLDKRWTTEDWLLRWARREGADLSLALPPSLLLRKEREALPAVLASQRSEQAVRDLVTDFNSRLLEAHRRPQEGPPLTLAPLDVEQAMREWRAARPAAPPAPTPAPVPTQSPSRGWWRLPRRRR